MLGSMGVLGSMMLRDAIRTYHRMVAEHERAKRKARQRRQAARQAEAESLPLHLTMSDESLLRALTGKPEYDPGIIRERARQELWQFGKPGTFALLWVRRYGTPAEIWQDTDPDPGYLRPSWGFIDGIPREAWRDGMFPEPAPRLEFPESLLQLQGETAGYDPERLRTLDSAQCPECGRTMLAESLREHRSRFHETDLP
jgi:hypothetical protein